VAFTSRRAGNLDIFVRNASGSGAEEALMATQDNDYLSDWSRDGKYLLYYRRGDTETGTDLWYLERTGDGSGWEPHPFLQDPGPQLAPRFSPNGRYVAYLSRESGRYEVYVDSFPERGSRWTVSSNGGRRVRWSRDGTELFYVEGDDTLMVVKVSTDGDFSASPATPLFEHPSLNAERNHAPYDVSADGRQFLLAEPVGEEEYSPPPQIRVTQNWHQEFVKR
jgi:Tol biopolymer transport system component